MEAQGGRFEKETGLETGVTEEELIEAACTGKGACLVPLKRLRALIPTLEERGLFVHSMEACIVETDGRLTPTFEYVMLGLHIGYDTDDDVMTATKQRRLLDQQLTAAEKSGLEIVFTFWLDDADDNPDP